MFGFGKMSKRVALIKELVEQRFKLRGQDNIESRLFVKSLGTLNSMSLPEATLVTILEAAIVGQSKGLMLRDALLKQESLRRLKGSDQEKFAEIIELSVGPNPAIALALYCRYRLCMESNNKGISPLDDDEIMHMLPIAMEEIYSW